ncbi:hemerythrin domain-containing protein [Puerhibacterium sp. TATVAM-FAB25]|uniref:hemerythrin domain-containing protein n=1 Tax=Puerhibacterium sp. TATVAM-FAB25 TaxID=3093699 RepID=UPI00397CEBDB
MTSIAEQTDAELGGRVSVLARQKRDHVKLDRLLQQLEGTHGQEQERVLLRIYRLVFPHAFAEESVLWPVMRRALPDGHALTLEVEQEHQEVNELVTRLERLDPDDPERGPVLERLVEVLREDVRDEEDELFPRLQAVTTTAELRRLGVYWEVLRRIAPTRAHPVVARRPPGNVISALPLSVLDRLRDAAEAVARRSSGDVADRLWAASRVLTAAAHRVERFPLLRIGEDPSTRSTGSAA